MRTQVAIVGAGPAGMLLAHLLTAEGIGCIVLERRTRAYVEGRVRAGILEAGTTDLLRRLGLGERLDAIGLPHEGFCIASPAGSVRIDIAALIGRHVTVYGQQEVMRDLFDAAEGRGVHVLFEADDISLHGFDGASPELRFVHAGVTQTLACDFIAGCDGYHGVCRASVPVGEITTHERVYPFGWLGILADVPPADHELIYAGHPRGFALASMRSSTRSRYYVQCGADESVDAWPDDRFWDELCVRLGPAGSHVTRGPSTEKSIAPLRSFVAEPMRFGRLFLAGDAAHIVPPTGAKGMNLAVSDVAVLSEALLAWYRGGNAAGLDRYSDRALARVWKAERFSWWFTGVTHLFPDRGSFEHRMQAAELAYIAGSEAARTSIAENYAGLPLEPA